MNIKTLDKVRYEDLFRHSHVSTPFHGLPFLKVIAEARPALRLRFSVLMRGKEVVAVMPFFTKVYFPLRLHSLPYGCYGGYIYLPEDREAVTAHIAERFRGRAVTTVISYYDRQYAAHLTPHPCATWVLDTRLRYEDFLSRMHYKTRNQVRKADKSEVEVVAISSAEELEQVKAIHAQLIRKHAITSPYKDKMFDALFRTSKTSETIRFMLAKWQGTVIAFSVFILNRTEVFYWINASHQDYLPCNGTNAILNHIAKYCTENDEIKTLNMGAVPPDNVSLLHYKKRWGAEERVYYTYKRKGLS